MIDWLNNMEILAQGNSMLPTLISGERYNVEIVEKETIKIGDIIVFCVDEFVICHRVVQKICFRNKSVFFVTKGDNCKEVDPFAVTADMIIGRICK